VRIDGTATSRASAVAVNDRGDVLVAWQSVTGVFAQIRTAGGAVYRAERLGNPVEPVTAISAVLTPDRAAAVAWSAQAISEGDAGSPATVDATFKAAGATRHFHSSQRLAFVPQLGSGHYVGERRVRLVLAPDGTIAAAWTAYQNGTFVVQTAELAGDRVGAAQTVSDPTVDSVLADLDAGPASELAVLWRTGVAGNDPGTGPAGVQAAVRAASVSAFGAAETIEQRDPVYGPTLRFDPSTGRVITAWGGAAGTETSVRAPVAPH
jgi:hypothetical protein